MLVELASRTDYSGNWVHPEDLRGCTHLDWRAQRPLPYYVAFGGKPAGMVELAPCPGWCGDETCCGLIDQYVTSEEHDRICREYPDAPVLVGKFFRFPSQLYALRQVAGRCVLFRDGRCVVHGPAKPLWCKVYVCDRMWQETRRQLGL